MNFEIEATTTHVHFWSGVRIPFEPKGGALKARDALRAALAGMKATGQLAAAYTSSALEFFDLENVLLYNVGTSHFSTLGADRIRVDRSFGAPPCAPSGMIFAHHHHYSTARLARDWRQQRVIGERCFAMPRKLTASTVWAAARASAVPSSVVATSQRLGLEVEVVLPASSRLASAMKALLDGVVASFHRHDGTGDLDLLVGRIAPALAPSEVQRLLVTGPQELGVRTLVRPFAKSVQWNPADDLLVTVELRRARTDPGPASCRATLFEAES